MLEPIVNGGQTGADQAGGRAAQACGIATGGGMPRGVLTETADGRGSKPHPERADLDGARELPTARSPAWTFADARDSDATLWFGSIDAPGVRATIEACRQLSQSCRHVEGGFTRPSHVAEGIVAHEVRVLNVAGHRESEPPGIGARSHSRFVARPHARGQPSGRPPRVLRRHRARERTYLWQFTQHIVSQK